MVAGDAACMPYDVQMMSSATLPKAMTAIRSCSDALILCRARTGLDSAIFESRATSPFLHSQRETKPLHRDELVAWLALEQRAAQIRFETMGFITQSPMGRDGRGEHETNDRIARPCPFNDRLTLLYV